MWHIGGRRQQGRRMMAHCYAGYLLGRFDRMTVTERMLLRREMLVAGYRPEAASAPRMAPVFTTRQGTFVKTVETMELPGMAVPMEESIDGLRKTTWATVGEDGEGRIMEMFRRELVTEKHHWPDPQKTITPEDLERLYEMMQTPLVKARKKLSRLGFSEHEIDLLLAGPLGPGAGSRIGDERVYGGVWNIADEAGDRTGQ